jgi:hypothetical protein
MFLKFPLAVACHYSLRLRSKMGYTLPWLVFCADQLLCFTITLVLLLAWLKDCTCWILWYKFNLYTTCKNHEYAPKLNYIYIYKYYIQCFRFQVCINLLPNYKTKLHGSNNGFDSYLCQAIFSLDRCETTAMTETTKLMPLCTKRQARTKS